jgi:hypothetical protein
MRILVLAGAGLVLAIVIGFLATSQSRAEKSYCDNLGSFKSSISTLVSSSSASDLQSNSAAVQSAWGDLKNSASNLKDNNSSSLDSAWSNFTQAITSLPQSGSIDAAKQTITNAAQNLQSAVAASVSSYDCSSS